jgi:hypothetical protein
MGHANISITLGRYGHLMPGNEAEAAKLLDDYLSRAVHQFFTSDHPSQAVQGWTQRTPTPG